MCRYISPVSYTHLEATNLPVGSVTYAIPEKSSAISVGTPILVQKDSKTYKYTITDLDASKGTGTVTAVSYTHLV